MEHQELEQQIAMLSAEAEMIASSHAPLDEWMKQTLAEAAKTLSKLSGVDNEPR